MEQREAIQARKKLKKFGLSENDPPGASAATTFQSKKQEDEVEIHFLLNSAYEHIGGRDVLDLEKPGENEEAYRPVRRAAKQADEDEEVTSEQDSKTESGEQKYVPKRVTKQSKPAPPPDVEVTVRVTNIMEFTAGREDSLAMQEEIRQLFETIRPPKDEAEAKPSEKPGDKGKKEEKRVPPIRVKLPLHESGQNEGKPRGFAFVTLWGKAEAELAIEQFDKKRIRGMVIRVELANAMGESESSFRPRGDPRSDKK